MSNSFVAIVTSTPELTPVMSAAGIDETFNFHESSFLDFPENDGVRNFIDLETEDDVYVADITKLPGLINIVKVKIIDLESMLDDLTPDEEDFESLDKELEAYKKILSTLEYLEE